MYCQLYKIRELEEEGTFSNELDNFNKKFQQFDQAYYEWDELRVKVVTKQNMVYKNGLDNSDEIDRLIFETTTTKNLLEKIPDKLKELINPVVEDPLTSSYVTIDEFRKYFDMAYDWSYDKTMEEMGKKPGKWKMTKKRKEEIRNNFYNMTINDMQSQLGGLSKEAQ